MHMAGDIWEALYSRLDGVDEDRKLLIRREANRQYVALCRQAPWRPLAATAVVDLSSGDAWLPADLLRVRRVVDLENEVEYQARGGALPGDATPRWFYSHIQRVPDFRGLGATVQQGDTSISSTAPFDGTAYGGQWIKLGTDLDCYQLNDAGTGLTRPRWADPIIAGTVQVRPAGMRKLACRDETNTVVESSTVTVWYTQLPPLLHTEFDIYMLADREPLEFAVAGHVLLAVDRRREEGQLYLSLAREAKQAMETAEPPVMEPMTPRAADGRHPFEQTDWQ